MFRLGSNKIFKSYFAYKFGQRKARKEKEIKEKVVAKSLGGRISYQAGRITSWNNVFLFLSLFFGGGGVSWRCVNKT